MKTGHPRMGIVIVIVIFTFLGYASISHAHCDTLDGPVVEAARVALASGDVTPVLKWVGASDEEAIRSAFQKTMEVRTINARARELADVLTGVMGRRMRELFQKTLEAGKHADENVAAGREYVEHYVNFTHFAENLHAVIKGGAGDHVH